MSNGTYVRVDMMTEDFEWYAQKPIVEWLNVKAGLLEAERLLLVKDVLSLKDRDIDNSLNLELSKGYLSLSRTEGKIEFCVELLSFIQADLDKKSRLLCSERNRVYLRGHIPGCDCDDCLDAMYLDDLSNGMDL